MIGTTAVYKVLTQVSLDTQKYGYFGGSTPVTLGPGNSSGVFIVGQIVFDYSQPDSLCYPLSLALQSSSLTRMVKKVDFE